MESLSYMTKPASVSKFFREIMDELGWESMKEKELRNLKQEKEKISLKNKEISREKEEISKENEEFKRTTICGLWKHKFPITEIADMLKMPENKVTEILQKEKLIL